MTNSLINVTLAIISENHKTIFEKMETMFDFFLYIYAFQEFNFEKKKKTTLISWTKIITKSAKRQFSYFVNFQNFPKFPCFGNFQNSLPKKPGLFPGLSRVFSSAHISSNSNAFRYSSISIFAWWSVVLRLFDPKQLLRVSCIWSCYFTKQSSVILLDTILWCSSS